MSINLARGPKARPCMTALPPGPARARLGGQDPVFPVGRDGLEASYAVGPERPVSRQAVLPVPPDLPGFPSRPRVLQLTDGDCVSHGLAGGAVRGRASDQEMRTCLDRVQAAAMLIDPHARVRCAVSTETAARHFDILAAARNNSFAIRRGLDGADRALIEELTDLIGARAIATRTRRRRPAGLADLVILVGKDKIYASPVRQLRLLGIPTWLIVPGRLPSASLYRAACAVSFIGPFPGSPNSAHQDLEGQRPDLPMTGPT
jgi:hypothetical protein